MKPILDNVVQSAIDGLIGKACCRQRLGRMRSLSIGFGVKIPHGKSRLVDDFYGEWEIGTYSAAWRVIKDGNILCGSQDVVDELSELEERFRQIQLGRIDAIHMVSKFDIRIDFDDGAHIDFLGASREDVDDEMFHIFCPSGLYVEYSIRGGWKVGNAGKQVDYSDENHPKFITSNQSA